MQLLCRCFTIVVEVNEDATRQKNCSGGVGPVNGMKNESEIEKFIYLSYCKVKVWFCVRILLKTYFSVILCSYSTKDFFIFIVNHCRFLLTFTY